METTNVDGDVLGAFLMISKLLELTSHLGEYLR